MYPHTHTLSLYIYIYIYALCIYTYIHAYINIYIYIYIHTRDHIYRSIYLKPLDSDGASWSEGRLRVGLLRKTHGLRGQELMGNQNEGAFCE